MSRKEKTVKEVKYDDTLFSIIQAKGGITFKEPNYIVVGDGYVRCLHIYELPNNLDYYWQDEIFNIEDCICEMDIATKDVNKVKQNINDSISKELAKIYTSKDYMELYSATKRKDDLKALYNEISSMGEIIKLCDFRIFVKAKSLQKLEERCEEIIQRIEGSSYKVACFLNEGKREWQTFYEPSKKSHEKLFCQKGLNLTTEQLSMGYPFDYSDLIDEQGDYMGRTACGGAVIFDEFTKTKKRAFYNSIVCGTMGSGKSTYLKKRFKANASKGNYLRVFDISGEFAKLTNEFGGKIIRFNGVEGLLNPLEILKAGDDDYTSYSSHIAKLQSFFKCISVSLTDQVMQELSNYLREFYSTWNLIPSPDRSITGLEASSYPTMSDFRKYIETQIEKVKEEDKEALTDVETSLNVERASNLNSIYQTITNLCNNYGNLFDGHTTINNITNEKIVTFDISQIKDLGNIFTACMELLVSLCWDNAVSNGMEAKEMWESGEFNPEDITKFLILIDESHRWVNTSMPLILDMIIRYEREARKYFAGITLASQSVRDFMPEGDTVGIDKIRLLFELSQYKLMFKQDSSSKEHIARIMSDGLTYSQVEQIPQLTTGMCYLVISGDRSIKYQVWLSKEYEEQIFAGGR